MLGFYFRSRSDVSILEAKVERLESQLLAKDREIATMARTVRQFLLYLGSFLF